MDAANPIMTIQDLSEYLQLNPLTIRRLAREKQLPIAKVGRQWRTTRVVIEQWFEQESLKNVAALFS